jgi:hypothetical protein
MALKDLISDRKKLTEAAIEDIVRDYIRYDPGTYEVVLTPSGLALGNDAKVLVILVGIAGWQYVVDEIPTVDTKPAALEQMTGITGGTLRPVLKKLKDAHLVIATDKGYDVRVANLDAIGRVVTGEKAIAKHTSRKARRTSAEGDDRTTAVPGSPLESGATKGRRKSGVPIVSSLKRLVDSDFFAEDRTLGQVVSRLHEMAIIAKTTSLSGPIANLVRDGKLTRKRVIEGGKDVWCYKSTSRA